MRWNTCLNFFGANESSRGSRVRANIEAALPFVPLHFKWTVVVESLKRKIAIHPWPHCTDLSRLSTSAVLGHRFQWPVAAHIVMNTNCSLFLRINVITFSHQCDFFKNLSDTYLAKSILSAHMLDRTVCFYFKPICAGVLNRYLSLQLTGSGGRQI